MSYLDDNVVGSAIKDACNDKRYLSKAIDFDSDVKDFSDNLNIKAKPETKRKKLNVPFEVDADKQSTDDDDFDN